MKKGISFLAFTVLAVSNFQIFAQAAGEKAEDPGFVYTLKKFFIDGGPAFMSIILICLLLGLAFVIERIIYLNSVDVNTDSVLGSIDDALSSGGVEEAKDVARDTKGPVASIAYQALARVGDGQSIQDVEKSVISYGGVEMGKLERNLPWIGLFISIAPMLGFMGTVIGMVLAFMDIEKEGTVDAASMAGNINVALLTTLFGLIVAIILQIGYTYLTAKIDSIVNKMEDASISLVDMLVSKTK